MRLVFIFIFLLLGVYKMEASEHWEKLPLPMDHVEISFPRAPTYMTFDIPLEKTEQQGKMEVYSSQMDHGLLLFSSIYSPLFNDKEIRKDKFEKLFYHYIVQRMFYQPQIFKTHKTLELVETKVQGEPAIRFSYSYLDNHETQMLSGLAVYKQGKIFILFILGPQNKFDQNTLKHFTDSFHFL